jgi:hypothetical protein
MGCSSRCRVLQDGNGLAGYLDPDQGKIDLPSAYRSCVNPRPGRFSYGQLKARRSPRVTRGFFYYQSLRPTPVAEFMAGFPRACTDRGADAVDHRVGVACRVPWCPLERGSAEP